MLRQAGVGEVLGGWWRSVSTSGGGIVGTLGVCVGKGGVHRHAMTVCLHWKQRWCPMLVGRCGVSLQRKSAHLKAALDRCGL